MSDPQEDVLEPECEVFPDAGERDVREKLVGEGVAEASLKIFEHVLLGDDDIFF